MKICTKEPANPSFPVLEEGRLYENKYGRIYLCNQKHVLSCLEDGAVWSFEGGFGISSPGEWKDVTDKWCLKEL